MTRGSSHRSIVIAWQGLPFYARRCLRHFREQFPSTNVHVVTSRLSDDLDVVQDECGYPVIVTDSESRTSFSRLGLVTPDHLFVTSWYHAAYRSLAREAKRSGAPVTTMVDNLLYSPRRQLGDAWLFRLRVRRLFDDAWVPGRAGQQFMRFLGMAEDRVWTGLYSADAEVFHPPASADQDRDGIVFVGQFIVRKGLEELWRAWKTMPPGVPALTLIGDGPLRPSLAAEGAPVEAYLRPVELAKRLRSASALILPSRIDHWGVVIHEAVLSGCLVLATRHCGAVHDLVVHGVNGFVMADCSVTSTTQALDWFRRLTPGELARARRVSVELAERFSCAKWTATVEAIVSKQRARRAG